MAEEVDSPFLGSLALRASYRDGSKPTALADSSVGEEYTQLAKAVKASLKEFGRDAA